MLRALLVGVSQALCASCVAGSCATLPDDPQPQKSPSPAEPATETTPSCLGSANAEARVFGSPLRRLQRRPRQPGIGNKWVVIRSWAAGVERASTSRGAADYETLRFLPAAARPAEVATRNLCTTRSRSSWGSSLMQVPPSRAPLEDNLALAGHSPTARVRKSPAQL